MCKARWTEFEFRQAVTNNTSIKQVLASFGLKANSGNYKTFYRYKAKWNINTSHFYSIKASAKKHFHKLNKLALQDILVENCHYPRQHLKRRLISNNLLKYECYECRIIEWLGKPLILQLDHINGINNDNRLDNLRLLCPNCHSQTKTYTSKRFRNVRYCSDCNISISKKSKRCIKCGAIYRNKHGLRKNKIVWPSTISLIHAINSTSYTAVAKALGVSDNAIRKRIKNHSGG